MITSFSVRNFKCFRQLDLPKLTRLTLLGGKNNVGKTALLEALFMFLDRENPQMVLRQYAARGIGAVPLTPEAMFYPIFRDYNVKSELQMSAKIDSRQETMMVRYNPVPARRTVKVREVVEGVPGSGIVKTDEAPTETVALDIEYVSGGFEPQRTHLEITKTGLALQVEYVDATRFAAMIQSRSRVTQNEVGERFGQLDVHGRIEELVDFLRIVEPKLRSLSAVPFGKTSVIHGNVGTGRKIPIAYMGEGLARMLEMMVFIMTAQGGLVLVDEIENGIHHSVLSQVWHVLAEAARRLDVQLVATTHSYECIAAAQRGLADKLGKDLTYIRLERKDDTTLAKTYDYSVLEAAIESEMEIR